MLATEVIMCCSHGFCCLCVVLMLGFLGLPSTSFACSQTCLTSIHLQYFQFSFLSPSHNKYFYFLSKWFLWKSSYFSLSFSFFCVFSFLSNHSYLSVFNSDYTLLSHLCLNFDILAYLEIIHFCFSCFVTMSFCCCCRC